MQGYLRQVEPGLLQCYRQNETAPPPRHVLPGRILGKSSAPFRADTYLYSLSVTQCDQLALAAQLLFGLF